MEYGTVHRGLMGIIPQSVDSEIAESAGLDDVKGVMIQRITPNSGAEEAGLLNGDIILSIDEAPIDNLPSLLEKLGQHRPGDQVSVQYFRDGSLEDALVTLKNQLNTTDLISIRRDDELKDVGFELRDLTNQEKKRLEVNGAKVHSITLNSTVDRTKMEPGYIITKVNGKSVNSVDEFVSLFKKQKGKIELEGVYENHEGAWWYVFSK
jgi:S1-C subfamily serine protease